MSVLLNFLKSIAGIPETKLLDPQYWRLEENVAKITIDQVLQLQQPGGAVYLSGNGLTTPILVVRDADGSYHGFSNRCTHFGRKLDPVPGKQILRCCSVSHSTFDYSGVNLAGPAKKPIKVYQTDLKSGVLSIFI
ncbi:MAG: ubiquinol-cytochrome c reductase iron-sulfur subunit [Desulfomonilaceae bacterium]